MYDLAGAGMQPAPAASKNTCNPHPCKVHSEHAETVSHPCEVLSEYSADVLAQRQGRHHPVPPPNVSETDSEE
jgi:hypothetical protein